MISDTAVEPGASTTGAASTTGGSPADRGITLRGFSLVMVSILSVQLGAATAKEIIGIAGPVGTVFYRVFFAAILVSLVARPKLRGRSRSDWAHIAAFGLALAGMNVCYYAALQYLPIGVTVTLEFTGPLAVAIFGSRRRVDVFWALLAAGGLILLSPLAGVSLDPIGVALALSAGAFWAGYILMSSRVGGLTSGFEGLALALGVSALVTVGPAVVTAGTTLLEPKVIGIGIFVAVLASAVPYGFELVALRSLTTSGFGMLMSLEPAVAAMVGAIVLSERLAGVQVAAIGCVLLANAGAVTTRPRRPATIEV